MLAVDVQVALTELVSQLVKLQSETRLTESRSTADGFKPVQVHQFLINWHLEPTGAEEDGHMSGKTELQHTCFVLKTRCRRERCARQKA